MTAHDPARADARGDLPSLALPAIRDLAARRQWVGWRFEQRGDGKWTKVPLQPNGRLASSTDPKTWATFAGCAQAFAGGLSDGVGFVFAAEDQYVGTDLDGCIGPDGVIARWAAEIVAGLDTYTEVSPSGTGLHLIGRGKLPGSGHKKQIVVARRTVGALEMYDQGRYFTMTGRVWPCARETIEDRAEAISKLYGELFGNGDASHGEATQVGELTLDPNAEPPAEKLAALLARHPRFGSTWEHQRDDLRHPDGSDDLSAFDLALASITAFAGWGDQEIADLLIAHRREHGGIEKALRPDYVARTLSRARESPRELEREGPLPPGEERMAPPSTTAPQRPTVLLSGRQLDSIIVDTLDALDKMNRARPELFWRGAIPSTVRRDEHGLPQIMAVGEAGLVEALSRAAHWIRHTKTGATVDAHPTRALAGVALQALGRESSALPPLRGITTSPLMRPDGTILEKPGYDAATGLVYDPPQGFRMPPVPEYPTQPQLESAVAHFGELLAEFPFTRPADKATAWALPVTQVLRPLIRGPVPLFLFDAPLQGSGKGLLAKAVTLAATGRPPSLMSPPGERDDSETRKRITSLLLEGAAVALIDNLERPLASPALAALLTSEIWTDRVLGHTEMASLPATTIWMASGNNLKLRGDLPRRSVWCRLDAKVAQPWTRTEFQKPELLDWVGEYRGELLAALLTMARAWIDAGSPGPDLPADRRPKDWPEVPRLGSYERWRHVVGGVLLVAGIPAFLANLPALYNVADEDTPAWAGFLATWCDLFMDPVTAAQLAKEIETGGKLHEALPGELASALEEKAKGSFTRRLGKALARKDETRFLTRSGSLRIARAGSVQNATKWQVLRDQEPTCADPGEAVEER